MFSYLFVFQDKSLGPSQYYIMYFLETGFRCSTDQFEYEGSLVDRTPHEHYEE